jgi:hypothetical protein
MESKNIHKEMLPIYGEKCEDEHCVGRPTEIATEANVQRVDDLIQADRRVTIDTIATAIGCSHSMA